MKGSFVGTRIKTKKSERRGCRGKALGIFVLVIALAGLLMGAKGCNIGGNPDNQTCSITARSTTQIILNCRDEDGKETSDSGPTDVPSDLYPKCQVGTYWPGCKGK